MDSAKKLADIFTKFPGIGARQARRFVYFLLGEGDSSIEALRKALDGLKGISQCSSCSRFFEGKSAVCEVCTDKKTDGSTLMVLEKDIDFEAVRRNGVYKGRYFILGGLLPILEKNPAEKIRIKKLTEEIGKQVKETGLKEIIIALSANPEGENTFEFVKKTLSPLSVKHGLKISGLGRGFSTGLELEYSDKETLKEALKNRG